MTHLQAPSAVKRAPLPAPPTSRPFPALLAGRTGLTTSLTAKRAAIASLEAAWVAAAEADAARTNTRSVRMDDRSTWDRATWDRYLTAASTHEPDYKSSIKRLLLEVQAIETLLNSFTADLTPPSDKSLPAEVQPRDRHRASMT